MTTRPKTPPAVTIGIDALVFALWLKIRKDYGKRAARMAYAMAILHGIRIAWPELAAIYNESLESFRRQKRLAEVKARMEALIQDRLPS